MAPFRFVHCADIHLDSPFHSAVGRIRRHLEDGRRATVVRLVDTCLEERVHALLVAGDLFDEPRLSLETEAFLVEQFRRLTNAGVTVVLAAGNHDPGGDTGRLSRIPWPKERFAVLGGSEPQQIVVEDASGETVGRVFGVGHRTTNEGGNLVAAFPSVEGSVPAVGLAHCLVDGVDDGWRHPHRAPCTIDDLAGRGIHYWALGHVHTRQEVLDEPPAHYAGSLVGRHYAEPGAKGALVVEVEAGGATTVDFRPLARTRFERIEPVGLADVHDLAQLCTAIELSFEGLATSPEARDDQEWLVRVELKGACPIAEQLSREQVRSELADRLSNALGALDVEVLDTGLSPLRDVAAHRGQPDLMGLSLEVIDDALENPELLDQLAASLQSVSDLGDVEAKRRAVRAMLADLDLLAAETLIQDAAGPAPHTHSNDATTTEQPR